MSDRLIYPKGYKQSKHAPVCLTMAEGDCKGGKGTDFRARDVGGAVRCTGCDRVCLCPADITDDQEIRIIIWQTSRNR